MPVNVRFLKPIQPDYPDSSVEDLQDLFSVIRNSKSRGSWSLLGTTLKSCLISIAYEFPYALLSISKFLGSIVLSPIVISQKGLKSFLRNNMLQNFTDIGIALLVGTINVLVAAIGLVLMPAVILTSKAYYRIANKLSERSAAQPDLFVQETGQSVSEQVSEQVKAAYDKGAKQGQKVIVLKGHVYDITSFMDEHPGGEEILQDAIEQRIDAIGDFEDVGHSDQAEAKLKNYDIGTVASYLAK